MRLIVSAALLLSIAPTPAHACHKFSYWRFPFPQRCPIPVHMVRAAPVQLPLPPSRDGDIAMPTLDADWGGCPPDMELQLRLLAKSREENL
jgi:hypothetical protein